MTPQPCPKCHGTPDVELVERTIGTLYRLHCCGMIAFGDPIRNTGKVSDDSVALHSAYARWNEACEEVGG